MLLSVQSVIGCGLTFEKILRAVGQVTAGQCGLWAKLLHGGPGDDQYAGRAVG